ncbi:hypothetical protein Ddye_005196 [Dipteronia dyeriana]|uniref:Uncharacterized protein n=1 Tax=Dipteronia dyeriana TaxID=168575 RepID=A0AAE0CQ13_9ROSI|nr:hypothetical protein Ddye_005196 [Dipteronia dyeriana]
MLNEPKTQESATNNYAFTLLLTGYGILGYIDGTLPYPRLVIKENGQDQVNHSYSLWIRQHKLILSAIIASLTKTMVSFIRLYETSKSAWDKLESTYGKPSKGHIMALKSQLRKITRGNKIITESTHLVKSIVDEISVLDTPVGDDYKELSTAIRARDNPISFVELHEKL